MTMRTLRLGYASCAIPTTGHSAINKDRMSRLTLAMI